MSATILGGTVSQEDISDTMMFSFMYCRPDEVSNLNGEGEQKNTNVKVAGVEMMTGPIVADASDNALYST